MTPGAAFRKLLFLRNLQTGPKSYGVCHWQDFPAHCYVTL